MITTAPKYSRTMPILIRLRGALLLFTGLATLALNVQGQDSAEPWFQEEATAAGLEWGHVSGAPVDRHWFPEIMGGGVALFDYDGDGDLDVYLVQSGHLIPEEGQVVPTNRLFKNMSAEQGAGGDPGGPGFVDVTEAAGVGDDGYGMGVACGDYDGDGDVDLYVTNVGPNRFYQNQGNGTFKDLTSRLKVGDGRWGTSAAFMDANSDGKLDLFVVNNLNWSPGIETPCNNYRNKPDFCSPNNYNAQSTDVLFVQGRLGYSDYSRKQGLHLSAGNGLGVACADYDSDGDTDIYVANDATPNALWNNSGTDNFTDVALAGGCAVNSTGTPEAGMGVQWVDVNQDGWFDLFMTHIRRETNTFYMNRKGRFRDMTNMTGLGPDSVRLTGFGMGFHDFNLDGRLDLYVANGAVQAWGRDESYGEDAYAEPNLLYQGLGGTRFESLGEGTASPVVGSSRGAAFGDIDNDGDVDVVVVDRDARVKLLRNVAPRVGTWLGVELKGSRFKTAVGAVVRLETSSLVDDEIVIASQYRLADPAYSYLASNDPRVHFGIAPGHDVTGLFVRWPGSTEEVELKSPTTGSYIPIQR